MTTPRTDKEFTRALSLKSWHEGAEYEAWDWARKLERELVELKAQQGDVERSNARFNWLLAYHNSTVGTKGLQPLSLKCLDEEFLSYNH